ncbi:DUF5615 family PIN-like protein [Sediminicola luteus]|uniref:DUF5615 domain-containing protein n=1 Tax=Sediminicola luteus TaxID=319238 RepID=A0A2A4G7U3_9FLAO|nr:DUF5615 family PIN-like protein [Sediminicola luteus]PCE64050.1 hypothetical protein B7P33_12465 [Sediminicola luteus]
MKLLLDENVPRKLKYRFSPDFEVNTVPEMGWTGVKNGELLNRMRKNDLKILISLDKNMGGQQHLESFQMSLIVFNVKNARYTSLVPLVEKVERIIRRRVAPGVHVVD